MIKHIFVRLLAFFVPLLYISWGFFAHQKINKMAIFTLPQPLMTFYKLHSRYIEEQATTPDKLRFLLPQEAPNHYLDVEEYAQNLDSIPRNWRDAQAKYGAEKLRVSGQLPWTIYRNYRALVAAFKAKEISKIVRISAYMAHYIADAHVPLHTTHNHNGQLTEQEGIHAFWESTVPEYFEKKYHYFVGRAVYLEKPMDEIWRMIAESHQKVDSVLSIEKQLSKQWRDADKYTFIRKGTQLLKKPSEAYAAAYQSALHQMMERRMRASIKAIGSFWYTAWVDAGQPNLSSLHQFKPSEEELKEEEKLNHMIQNQNIIGREL